MRGVSLRRRLADQQRLLDGMEWPRWVRVGMPAAAAALGAVAVWDHVRTSHFVDDPPASTVPGAVLIALSVLPWASFFIDRWWPHATDIDPVRYELGFSLAVLVPLAAVHVGGEWLGVAGYDAEGPQLSLLILLLLAVQTAACASAGVTVAVTAAILGIIVGRAALSDDVHVWFVWLVATTLPLAGGLAMRSNFVALQRLREAQDALARQAVADERRRIAREVHDTVAHTLAVTMLHLTAARMAVERAPERAVAALEEAERQGRAGMGDIRRVVRLLRAVDEGHGAGVPLNDDVRVNDVGSVPSLTIERALPTVGELPELIACYEAAGLTVSYTCSGDAGTGGDSTDVGSTDDDNDGGDGAAPRPEANVVDVPPAVGLAVFRVAQESLANAAKHGCGDADVRLCVGDHAVVLTVRNRCHGDAVLRSGMGVVGMRERVIGLGGDFRAGPAEAPGRTNGSADGSTTWEVAARIPTGARL